jgi:Tfp pilus assembly protein PilN
MINLLPEREKHELLKEYRLRVVVIVLVAACVLVAVSLLLLVPAYVLSNYQQQISRSRIATANQAAVDKHAELIKQIQQVKQTIGVLQTPAKTIVPTDALNVVLRNKSAGISLTSLEYSATDFSVALGGIAKTREDLARFSTAIKADSQVESVDFPISSLAKDTNLSFNVSIKLKHQ